MTKPISISLSPNTEKDDIDLAFKLIYKPWIWKKGQAIEQLENEFKSYLGVKHAVSFNSGRSAFLAILESLPFNDKTLSCTLNTSQKEVLLQAFTCNAASNPIIWAGLKPVYQDVDKNNFNIDVESLKNKLTSRSRAIVVQHTFGLPVNMDEVLEFCQKNDLILIEDCAHSLGASYKGKKVGTFGTAAFFSFSRDKVISSVYGGMAVTDDDELAKKLRVFQERIGYPSSSWILQQLRHPVLMDRIILPTYGFLGKYLLVLFQRFNILSKAVHWKEKKGKKPGYFPKRLPNALAILALNQFKKLDRFNEHRKKIAQFYFENLKNSNFVLPLIYGDRENIFLRFPIKHYNAHQIIKEAWRKNILIGDWYTTAIAPHDTKMDKLEYYSGDCPGAEELSEETLNLPTHINISEKDAQKILSFLRQYDSPVKIKKLYNGN
ncbi:MAG: DegT/DnrJ/EryC1/StrS family aminotransferase [Candidatus Nealsonbacteria bacterium]|nr:DegT/DnrJ/EryC1/StrS family aminotransferase [Candidatus Nealsonbacteria bacterium]